MNSYRKQSIWQGLILLFVTVSFLMIAPTYVSAAVSVRFVVTGDSRGDKYDDDGVNQERLSEMAKYIDDYEDADFIIFTGDLVYGPSPDNPDMEPFKKQLKNWKDIMDAELSVPVYPVRGNHDDSDHQAWRDVFDLPLNGPSDEKEITYSVSIENVFIVGLDQYGDPDYTIDQDWLNTQFNQNNKPHVFVFGHAPAFHVHNPKCLDDYSDERNAFWNSFACEGGRIYFAGHDHFYNHARIADGDGNPDNDLHQFVVGTAGAPLYIWDGNYDGDNDPWVPQLVFHEKEIGYVVVEIDGQNVTATWKHRTGPGSYASGGDIFSYNSATTACFEDGVFPNADYLGTTDTVLSEDDPNSNFGDDIMLYVDGDDPSGSGKDLEALIKWDISAIPPHSYILGACITTHVTDKTNDTYELYEIMEDWKEDEATWIYYNFGDWQEPGARGPADRGKHLGSFSPKKTGTYKICLNDDGLNSVQSWVNNPSSNHGLIIDNPNASDGADFDSREASTKSDRPKLTVLYTDVDSLSYTPVTPCKIVDTRKTSAGMIGASTERDFHVFGNGAAISAQGGTSAGCPSPLGDPLAAHINMVAVNPTGKGNLKAFPQGVGATTGLSVNYNTIDTNLANAGTVKTTAGTGKDITVASNFSSAHVTMQVLGYYYPDGDLLYTPVTPCKIVDTRNTSAGTIGAGTQRNFYVFGDAGTIGGQGGDTACPQPPGAPVAGPLAAHINMVAVNPTGKGNLKAFPKGVGATTGLSVNYNTIDTNLANAGTVKTTAGAGKDITAASNFSSAHVTMQVLGYYYLKGNFSYTPVSPCKIVDTRNTSEGMIDAGTQRNFYVRGSAATISAQGGNPAGCKAPLGEPRAVHINMVAVDPTGKGNLKAFPKGVGATTGLSVNYNTIDTNLANAGTVKTSFNTGSDITVASNFSSAHVTIQVLGYYY